MSAVKHRRWTTVLDNSPADREAGRDMTGWVGVSDATEADFARGIVHGRPVEADDHCTPDCDGCGADSGEECFPGCMSHEETA